jgi:uncharacterized protein
MPRTAADSPTTTSALRALEQKLGEAPRRVIACSGGIDSMLLATVSHRFDPSNTTVAHAISPAVPAEATARVRAWSEREGWNLTVLTSGEFGSEDYLSNPVNRCYFCKSNLYLALEQLRGVTAEGSVLMSGANVDDLGEYRPGLIAAEENAVRHPYIEAGIDKEMIRALARSLDLPFAEIPASPCLASRLYTGTRVTEERLRSVEAAEALIRAQTGIAVVRCRIRDDQMLIEVGNADRHRVTQALIEAVRLEAAQQGLELTAVELDDEPYRPGRAFVGAN